MKSHFSIGKDYVLSLELGQRKRRSLAFFYLLIAALCILPVLCQGCGRHYPDKPVQAAQSYEDETWCFDTKHGLKTYRAGTAPCPDISEVESATSWHLGRNWEKKNHHAGMEVVFVSTPLEHDDFPLGVKAHYIPALRKSRVWLRVRDSWGQDHYHELCHDDGYAHGHPCYKRYESSYED